MTLVELVLAMGLFGLLNLLLFAALQSGTRSYAIAVTRSDLQGDLNRCLTRLQAEIRRSSAGQLVVVTHPGRMLDGHSRHGICLSSLQDWRAGSSYNADGDPLWDEYISYYASLESPGRLVRQTHRPAGAPYTAPMAGFGAGSLVIHGPGSLVLTQHLEEFRLRYDGASQVLEMELRLRRKAGRTPEGKRVQEESVQASCQLRVCNP